MIKQMMIATLLISLSACSTSTTPPLEERLKGKTAQERQEIMRLECLNEAERAGNPPRNSHTGHRGHRHTDSQQTKRLKEICREMTATYPVDQPKE